MSAGPLRGWIRPGDELRDRLAGRAPGSLIQGIEIFPDGPARPGDGLPVDSSDPAAKRCLLASAAIRLASTAKAYTSSLMLRR
jgi:hypothetical protein